jgi:hypothetical protein
VIERGVKNLTDALCDGGALVHPSFLARNFSTYPSVVIVGDFERFEEHGVAKLQLIER